MADLTDEERAAAILGDEVEPKGDETPTEPADPDQPEDEKPEGEEEPEEEEKPTEPEKPEPDTDNSTFTKQFSNLKGETLQEYNESLETAYDNSFKESLRLVEENKQLANENAQLKAQIANPQAPQPTQTPPAEPATSQPTQPLSAIDNHPLIQDVKEQRKREMVEEFDEFKKQYPQVMYQDEFAKFTKASDGVTAALTALNGYRPSWMQIYEGVAQQLGWQPEVVQSKKNNAIKENAAGAPSLRGQSTAQPKKPKVSDAEVDTYLKMFTSKTREDAVKELSEVK